MVKKKCLRHLGNFPLICPSLTHLCCRESQLLTTEAEPQHCGTPFGVGSWSPCDCMHRGAGAYEYQQFHPHSHFHLSVIEITASGGS